jgi:hypothetical protein
MAESRVSPEGDKKISAPATKILENDVRLEDFGQPCLERRRGHWPGKGQPDRDAAGKVGANAKAPSEAD